MSEVTPVARKTVVIAGASGFVGSALARRLTAHYRVICLSRVKKESSDPNLEWRSCDLFSLIDAEAGLAGAEIAYYLVHSMMPSARLTQGSFEDLDWIAADNFARAAAKNGVRQIIYLGGLIPPGVKLSRHLRSRLEVEKTLGGYSPALTALRAGIVVGAAGSSFQILYRLVKNLPVMLLPRWTKTPTQPIALPDVVDLLEYCLDRPATFRQAYDIGGPDIVTYGEMIVTLARLMGLRRKTFNVRFFSPGLSRLWVSLITGAPRALIKPLIQSLRHAMVCSDRRLQELAGVPGADLATAFRETLAQIKRAEKNAPVAFRGAARSGPDNDPDVRSVQRFTLPAGRDAKWVAAQYATWLPRHFLPVRVRVENGIITFGLPFLKHPLLVLNYSAERSSATRSLYYIRGGFLAQIQGRGRLEFRETSDRKEILAAVHDFRPRLPWFVYSFTQAPIHWFVMWRFKRHLAKLALR